MILVNIFRSALDDKYDTLTPEHEITIRELFPGVDFTDSVISVNGFQEDENYLLREGDVCTIRLFPEGNNWQSAAAGALVGLFVGGIPGALIGAGIGAVANAITEAWGGHSILEGIMKWIAPNISDPESPESLKTIPQLRGAENQSNRNRPIPLVMGKHLYTPMYIGAPYTEIGGTDGEDQYFTALYLLGWGKLEVKDIKLGPISWLAHNAAGITDDFLTLDGLDPAFEDGGPQLELRQGPNPGREDGEAGLYPQKVVEEKLGVELINVEGNVLKADRFTAKNPMKVQIEFTFNNGLISYNEKGEKQDAFVNISIQWKMPQESDNQWKEFGRIGTDQNGNSPTNYFAPVTAIIRQEAKIKRFIAERSFDYAEVKDALDRTIELRIVRTSVHKADDNRTADTVYLTAIRTWCFDPDKSAEAGECIAQAPMIAKYRDKTARLAFRIKAGGAVQGTINALNCIVQSYARVWDGTGWIGSEVPTNNPASTALKILQSPALGSNAYSDAMLDLDSFGGFYEWCNERGYTCNGVLTAEKRLDDLLAAVLSTGRGMRILNGSQYGVLIDQPRENPVLILNNQNVLEAGNQKNFEDLPDGFSIKFIYAADGYQETEVFVMADGSKGPGPESRIESIEMPFVTDYEQIVKNGWYQLACRRLRPEIWTRKVSIEGYLVGIGDRVEVQDDTVVVGLGEGAAVSGLKVENGFITEIYTDGAFDVSDTSQRYGLKIMQFDGANPGKIRTIEISIPEPGIYRSFKLGSNAVPVNSAPPLPHEGDLIAFGIYDRITTPALCFGKKDNGDGTFELTLLPYQEGVYTADSGKIPPYQANITTPQALAPPGDMPPNPATKSEILETIGGMDFSGDPATVYELRPSVTIVKRLDDGTAVPGAISCGQVRTTGYGPQEVSHKTLTYITSEDDTPEYYTGSITIGSWDWIEFILSDNGVELDRERVLVLRNGIPATVYELRPGVNVISRAQDGITLEPAVISCAQESITGTGAPKTSNKTLRYLASGNDAELDYSGPVAVDSEWEWIEFRLYGEGDNLLDRERVLILYQYVPATVYELVPSVSIIKHKYDDTIEPASISCGQVKYTPGLSPSPGDKVIRYVTSDNPDAETVYTGAAVPVNPAWAWIEFRLYEGASLLDLERVPAVYDGADGIAAVVIDFSNDNKSIPCNEDGIPHLGALPFTNQASLYNAGGGSIAWSLVDPPAGVSIDQTGLITVSLDADLGLITEIHAAAVLSGKTYTKSFDIVKLLDGTNPIFLDLVNDNKTIACDEYGVPLPGVLPFTNQAFLYRGNKKLLDLISAAYYPVSGGGGLIDPPLGDPETDIFPVAPAVTWFIKEGPPGVVVNEWNGIVTVRKDAELNDNDDVVLAAYFEGNEYTGVFNLSKAYAGKTPIFVDMDYQDLGFKCYADGRMYPGELPMAVQVKLYRGWEDVTADASWSLSGNPSGVSIDPGTGLITIAANAGLSERNTVTVQAVWRGDVYTDYLRLRKVFDGKEGPPGDQGKQGDPSPHYRGKVVNLPGNEYLAIGKITIQGVLVQMYAGDWVAYVGSTSGIWVNGMCMRWTGVGWETIPVSADGDFETNPYVAALMDLTEGAGNGTFMSILVRDLIAKTAMIEYIASHKLHIQSKDGSAGAVYGGGYDENGNPTGGPGFYLGTDGVLKADNLEANRGTFKHGTFDGVTIKGNSTFSGSITSGPLVVSDENSGGGTITYPKDTTASYLYNRDNIADGINVSGNYNGKAMARISGSMETVSAVMPGHYSRNYYINIVYQDGTSEMVAHTRMTYILTSLQSTTEVKRLLYPLTFTFVNGGKTVKLIGLPSNKTPAGSGKIYTMTDGNGTHLMIN